MPGARRVQTEPELTLAELVDALERAGLRGHGGAFFPTATKLAAVAAQPGRPIVVVNGAEGEPLSHKDRFLLGARSETVLNGALSVARVLGADSIVIAVDHRRRQTRERLETVLSSRPEGSARRAPKVEVVGVPDGFITGQESALVRYLGGGEAKPTATPPRPFEKGLHGRPTFVSNAETFAQIGRVLSGRYDGGRVITVSGAVARTALVEVVPGMTLAGVLDAAGGHTEPLSAILLGGYGGTWTAVDTALELSLDEPTLRLHGLTLGSGIVFALGQSACGVAEVARVSSWMAGQGAGQCGPCVFGLAAIAGALGTLCRADTRAEERTAALAQVSRWCAMVKGRGACAHPDGVARYVTSALVVMSESFADHAARGPCDRCDVASRELSRAHPRSARVAGAGAVPA